VGTGPLWQGPLQARVTAGGGDKTVNFSVRGPNAIVLEKFGVRSTNPWVGVTLVVLLPLAVIPLAWLALHRRAKRLDRQIKD